MNGARWRIRHRTSYTYSSPARDSFNEARLRPATNERQTLESFDLAITPTTTVWDYNDFYANRVHHFEVLPAHQSLVIESRAVVTAHPKPPLADEFVTVPLAAFAAAEKPLECFEYLSSSRFVDLELGTWRLAIDATVGKTDTWQAVLALMRFIHGHLAYAPASTHVHTTARDALAQRRGVCQDFAHLMLGMCRSIKVPARYVSGYLAVEKANATHAWVEAWIPTIGWLPLDPTHNQQADHTYIKIGAGRDYSDVPPVAGTYRGPLERKLAVEVDIENIG